MKTKKKAPRKASKKSTTKTESPIDKAIKKLGEAAHNAIMGRAGSPSFSYEFSFGKDSTITIKHPMSGKTVTLTQDEVMDKANLKEKVDQLQAELKAKDGITPLAIAELKSYNLEKMYLAPQQMLAIYDSEGNIRRTTAEDVAEAVHRYNEKFSLPSIPGERCNFNQEFKEQSYKEVFLKGKIDNRTTIHAAIDGFQDKVEKIKRTKAQEEYNNLGAAEGIAFINGLEHCLAILESRNPNYTPINRRESAALEAREPGVIMTELLGALEGREDLLPTIIKDVTNVCMTRLKVIAEQAGETSEIAHKRFEEGLRVIHSFSNELPGRSPR